MDRFRPPIPFSGKELNPSVKYPFKESSQGGDNTDGSPALGLGHVSSSSFRDQDDFCCFPHFRESPRYQARVEDGEYVGRQLR